MAFLPASYQQRQFWWLTQIDPTSSAYTVSPTWEIIGPLNITALRKSLSHLVERYEVLRSTFTFDAGRLLCAFTEHAACPFDEYDCVEIEESAFEAQMRRWIETAFDLGSGPLFRAALFTRGENRYRLVLAIHHSICDLRTKELIANELAMYYRHHDGSESVATRHAAGLQYAHYIQWQNEWLASPQAAAARAYWRDDIAQIPAELTLPADCARPSLRQLRGSVVRFTIPSQLKEVMTAFCRQYHTSPFLVLLTAYARILSLYSRQDAFAIGVPFTNRRGHNHSEIIGCFTNIVPIRIALSPTITFRELLDSIRRSMLLAHRNQELPTEQILATATHSRRPEVNPLFQTGFTSEPLTPLVLDGCAVNPVDVHHGGAQLDLFLTYWETGATIEGVIEYNQDLFRDISVQRMAANYVQCLESCVALPDSPVAAINCLGAQERQLALHDWNATERAWDEPDTVHEVLLRQCQSQPDAVAVVDGNGRISYAELDKRSISVAAALAAQGACSGATVAVGMDRSVDMVTALLGVWRAGCAYLPLDPDFPPARIDYMIEDSGACCIISDAANKERFANCKLPLLIAGNVTDDTAEDLPNTSAPDALAYITYTSGSTGKPKGVEITHGSVVNFLRSFIESPGIKNSDRLVAITTISFDIHILELFGTLCAGATLYVAPRGVAGNGEALAALLASSRATIMQATPTTWRLLCAAGWRQPQGFKALCGGEAMPRDLAKELLERCEEVWNLYGPTETTVWSTCHKLTMDDASISIGKPIANTRVYIVDPAGAPRPIGAWGELWIGGAGVARGYHNLAAMTAQKFGDDPFTNRAGDRVYRTGDTCRWAADGMLEFAGRGDNQIKIRGFRIETGEIETALRAHPLVADAVVTVWQERSIPMLVGYVVLVNPHHALTIDELRAHLRLSLPEYMIPSHIEQLAALPLTPNKKVDRNELPRPQITDGEQTPPQVSGASALETRLIALWSRILQRSVDTLDGTFFDLGGNSLLLVELQQAIQVELNTACTITALFQYPTIRSFAASVQPPTSAQSTAKISDRGARQRDVLRAMRARHNQDNTA